MIDGLLNWLIDLLNALSIDMFIRVSNYSFICVFIYVSVIFAMYNTRKHFHRWIHIDKWIVRYTNKHLGLIGPFRSSFPVLVLLSQSVCFVHTSRQDTGLFSSSFRFRLTASICLFLCIQADRTLVCLVLLSVSEKWTQ